MKLDGQVAVITGSGRGIGRAIALAYAREGAKLALAARNESELQEAVSAVSELGAEAIAVRTDVTSQQDTERLAHRVVEQFGHIDVLVDNAGNSGPIGALQGNDIADWVNTINVNLTGTFLVCQAVIPIARLQHPSPSSFHWGPSLTAAFPCPAYTVCSPPLHPVGGFGLRSRDHPYGGFCLDESALVVNQRQGRR